VTASRAQQVAFTLPYYREGVGLLLPANSKYKEIDDLQAAGDSVTVAVLQNVYAEELVHQALPKAKVDQYDSVDLMYQAVNSGRADAAATDQSSVKYLMVQTLAATAARPTPGARRLTLAPSNAAIRIG
jgi:polar amino acid transport system substrate-binding protein